MICFHFTIFVVLETTESNFLSWPSCCDLLSFYYLCRTGNNGLLWLLRAIAVVICFHFTIFVVLETTYPHRWKQAVQLWFAFILLSLSYWKQLGRGPGCRPQSCDLLSFYYLCRTGNNITASCKFCICVVICFHFTIFVVLETTNTCNWRLYNWLWFAFILLSLSYWKQPMCIFAILRTSCDLLSFYYLCRTGNNPIHESFPKEIVVICFHFTIFVVLETTIQAIYLWLL